MGEQMTRKRYNNTSHIRTECIYCSHVAYVIKMTALSKGKFYREVTYRCDSATCGLTWVCAIEPLRALTLAENKNGVPMLPLSQHLKAKKEKLLAQLNQREFTLKQQEVQGELDV